MRYDLSGKRVLLTGASSGIGRELAHVLALRGAVMAIAARRGELLDEVAEEVERGGGVRPKPLVADLSERGAAARLADQALAALGEVDVLVNNAGGGVGGTQWAVGDADAAREAFEVNFWSPAALVERLVPPMRARRSGVVVNVTSMSQLSTLWLMGHYSATKGALAQTTETLRLELEGSGVHVLQVIPGPTDTAVQGESRLIPGADRVLGLGPMGKPDQLARRIATAIERGRKRIVYPRALRVPYTLPALSRLFLERTVRRLSGVIDSDDTRVVRTGAFGDEEARAARGTWEQERRGRG